jgi:hypothetical protein
MSVPTYDPKAWALLYFPTAGYPYPTDPEDLFSRGADGLYAGLALDKLRIVNNERTYKDISYHSTDSLLGAVEEALNDDIVVSGARLFTVHNLGMLQRLINRLALKQKSVGMPTISFRQWDQAVDLVEEFHRPAVLTYEARKAFSSNQVGFWLDMPSCQDDTKTVAEDIEMNTLLNLCRLL